MPGFVSGQSRIFREIAGGVTATDLQTDYAYARARDKSDKSLDACKFFINALYVALTRAIANVYVLERESDHPLLAGESGGGVTCAIEMSPYTTSVDWQESALVCFEHGWIRLDLPAPLAFTRPGRVEIFRDPGQGAQPRTEIPQLPWIHAMWRQAQNFVDAVAGKRPAMCTAEDALEDIRLAREYIRMLKGR